MTIQDSGANRYRKPLYIFILSIGIAVSLAVFAYKKIYNPSSRAYIASTQTLDQFQGKTSNSISYNWVDSVDIASHKLPFKPIAPTKIGVWKLTNIGVIRGSDKQANSYTLPGIILIYLYELKNGPTICSVTEYNQPPIPTQGKLVKIANTQAYYDESVTDRKIELFIQNAKGEYLNIFFNCSVKVPKNDLFEFVTNFIKTSD
jgi:hypothetical protein